MRRYAKLFPTTVLADCRKLRATIVQSCRQFPGMLMPTIISESLPCRQEATSMG